MVLSIIALILILTIVFYQSLQGVFSSLLMAMLTLVCVLIAFNFYEPLAAVSLYGRMPAIAEPVALMALLILPLLGLRIVLDRFIGLNIKPDPWVDRIGAGAFGLVTALLLVGTTLIAVQMLPWGPSVLGYEPYDADLERNDSLWIDAPAFTLGTVKTLSAGSMSPIGNGHSFGQVHEDLTLAMWGARNRNPGATMDVKPDALRVLSVHDVTDQPYPTESGTFGVHAPTYPAMGYGEGSQVLIVRVQVNDSARDADNWYRLRGTQFRMVDRQGRSFFPVGYLVNMGMWEVQSAPIGELQISREAGSSLVADLLFRVPHSGGRPASPEFLTFRRLARASLRQPVEEMPQAEQALNRRVVSGHVAVVPPSDIEDRYFMRVNRAEFQEQIPITFRVPEDQYGEYANVSTQAGARGQIENGQFVRGEVHGVMAALSPAALGSGRAISTLGPLQGYRVLKLTGPRARSWPANVQPESLLQPQVLIAGQEPIPASGIWVRYATRSGQQVEVRGHLFYDRDLTMTGGPLNAGVLQTVRQNLSEIHDLGLIFLVPRDAVVIGFRLSPDLPMVRCADPLQGRQGPSPW